MQNFHMVSKFKIDSAIDQLGQWPELWNQFTARQDHPGSPHKDTKAIYLRWAKEMSIDTVFTDLEAVNYPAYNILTECRMLVRRALKKIGNAHAAPPGRVMITSLKPDGQIIPHTDEGKYADHYERFHLVLQSDPKNAFCCDGERVYMQPGELWWFDHKKRHWVINDSDRERIHLIIDCQAPLYRRERDVSARAV